MTVSLSPSAWVRSPHPLPQAQLRLFCFPYGGGDASLFHAWPQALPPDVADHIEICPIQLPGRAHRIHEPLFTRLSSLIDVLVPQDLVASPLYPYLDKPFAFFGASLGGLLAFEIAHALDTRHQRSAVALCVAATRAPQFPGAYGIEGAEHLNDAELVEQIRVLGGTPEAILSNEKHLRLILPKIRADAMMAATYVYTPGLSLDCPITVCAGVNDGFISFAELAAWQAHTWQTFRMYTFAGDHFFVRDATPATRAQLLEYLARTVRYALTPGTALALTIHGREQVTMNGDVQKSRGNRGSI
ncbi:hypothetical protein KDA_76190 [Dictyobacter alpinus]|uniref:Thioesterase domain-containing protein n=1 Tax=Dictyobacter alpinus TaxID=2014873 RepID=A0A402BL89_9CHLR|nr:thioesterase domain-containing protein [Dictyobacter alpinus]GCE32135.1 hypothetical protein KDA_76190 [Dictyobacter alpinus]